MADVMALCKFDEDDLTSMCAYDICAMGGGPEAISQNLDMFRDAAAISQQERGLYPPLTRKCCATAAQLTSPMKINGGHVVATNVNGNGMLY